MCSQRLESLFVLSRWTPNMWISVTTSVNSGCCHRCHRLGDINDKHVCLRVQKAGRPQSKSWQVCSPGSACSLRGLPSPAVLLCPYVVVETRPPALRMLSPQRAFLLLSILNLSPIAFQSPTCECCTIGVMPINLGVRETWSMMNFILACSHVLQPVPVCSFLPRLWKYKNGRGIAFSFSVPKTTPDTFPLFFLCSLMSRAKCHFFKLWDWCEGGKKVKEEFSRV